VEALTRARKLAPADADVLHALAKVALTYADVC
jgi:hypothetical protein